MKDGLVSIMIPCYNGEKFLDRLFTSFLLQTYKNQQIIFVNDGSIDKTEDKVMYYKKQFKEQGIDLIYLYQRNSGQAAAINAALSYLEGEYCMWFDVDDFMTNDHIEKKVNYLSKHPDKDLVMCKGYAVAEENIEKILFKLGYEKPIGTLFEDIIFEYRRCTPGLYMVRTKVLIDSLKDRKIYESCAGQNMQLLLPVSHTGRNGYIEDILYYYVYRQNSHSRSFQSSEDLVRRMNDLEELKLHIIENMSLPNDYQKDLIYYIRLHILLQRIELVSDNGIYEENIYIKELLKSYFYFSELNNNLKDRELFLWGACQKSDRIKQIIEHYSCYRIKGYLDSDRSKEKRNDLEIFNLDNIHVQKQYIIIPIEIHWDIIEKLLKRNFKPIRDFFYPKYEIRRFLEKRKYADI